MKIERVQVKKLDLPISTVMDFIRVIDPSEESLVELLVEGVIDRFEQYTQMYIRPGNYKAYFNEGDQCFNFDLNVKCVRDLCTGNELNYEQHNRCLCVNNCKQYCYDCDSYDYVADFVIKPSYCAYDIRLAIMRLVAYRYEYRGEASSNELEDAGVKQIFDSYKQTFLSNGKDKQAIFKRG